MRFQFFHQSNSQMQSESCDYHLFRNQMTSETDVYLNKIFTHYLQCMRSEERSIIPDLESYPRNA